MKNKILFAASVFVLVATLLVVAAFTLNQGATPSARASESSTSTPRTLTVTGNGQVTVEPDMATVTIGVRTQLENVKEAFATNTSQTEAVIAMLKSMGIDEKDIQTSNFNIYQMENWNKPMNADGTPAKEFVVENTVTVKVRNLPRLGEILSSVVDAGANSIWGITFDREDKAAAMEQARAAAVESAKAQAEALAKLGGVQLGEILTLNSYTSTPVVYSMYGVGGGGAAAEVAKAAPISPGQLTITADVNITYVIK